jgi:MFS family permease
MVRLPEYQLGLLYTINGLIVVLFQVPVTALMKNLRLSSQIAAGALFYGLAYAFVGLCNRFDLFVLAIVGITLGEIIMSPPALALTARLAPERKSGRYMGFFGFFVTSGWSLGPLYGGSILDALGKHPFLAWTAIASLAWVAGAGYLVLSHRLPRHRNR